MSKKENVMTIQEVSRLTGLTMRTLRWYDKLQLVIPDRDPCSDYRIYRSRHLKTLQQVLFFREIGFSLAQIKEILKNPHFDRRKALETQLKALRQKKQKMDEMIHTLSLTLDEEKGIYNMKDNERFKGFDFSHNPYEAEARSMWGDKKVNEANERLQSMNNRQKEDFAASMDTLFTELAAIREMDSSSRIAQDKIKVWYELLNRMGTYTPEMFANLGNMYVDMPEFTKNIDRYGEGLARFMRDAMLAFAKQI